MLDATRRSLACQGSCDSHWGEVRVCFVTTKFLANVPMRVCDDAATRMRAKGWTVTPITNEEESK